MGIEAVRNGVANIGMSSRKLKAERRRFKQDSDSGGCDCHYCQ